MTNTEKNNVSNEMKRSETNVTGLYSHAKDNSNMCLEDLISNQQRKYISKVSTKSDRGH